MPPTQPFESAEEAWWWFVRCHIVHREGGRFQRSALSFGRPCEPDNHIFNFRTLARAGQIGPPHLDVLERYGLQGHPPDDRNMAQSADCRRWVEALRHLETVLRNRGALAA
ncbi:MAG: hypothetical protein O3A88_00085 [Proteobacteria bacterium]|nr:hypothetical protein [Pseudomonadota bacterium]